MSQRKRSTKERAQAIAYVDALLEVTRKMEGPRVPGQRDRFLAGNIHALVRRVARLVKKANQ